MKLSKKYDRSRLLALNFGFELLYARFKCSKYQKPWEDWSRAILRHALTFGITGRTTFWSISHKDFFLPELSAIVLWVSLDFQRPWHFSSQEIKRDLPKVVCLWNMTHHPLQPGQWLLAFQPSGSWASNKASTVGSLAFSEVRFGKFSFVVLQAFSFKHSPNINLVSSQFFWHFLSSWLDHCPLPHWQAASSSPCWASLQAVRLQIFFLWPLGSPSSEQPCKSWIWPLPTAWMVWQWNLCQVRN